MGSKIGAGWQCQKTICCLGRDTKNNLAVKGLTDLMFAIM